MLPTFFVIGAHKAGTTTLWSILDQHPDVFVPPVKETNFLFDEGNWRLGSGWYESLYEPGREFTHRGDVSPGYSMFPFFLGPPERAAALVPDARVIYIIRHPVERMISAWAESISGGFEHRPLEKAVVWGSNYLLPSCYGLQLSRWAALFPREALLVLRSEDLAADPGTAIDRILVHLGLQPGWRPVDPGARLNRSEDKLIPKVALRRVSGAIRGAGFEGAAVRLARRRSPLRRLRPLVRPLAANERTLAPRRSEALLELFRHDFEVLRELVGRDLDLYGIA